MDPTTIPCNRGGKRKKEYSEQEKRDYLHRYKQSTLGKHKFCEQHGIAVSTLYRWLMEASTETVSAEAPVKQALQWQAISSTPSPSGLQLHVSHALCLKLPASISTPPSTPSPTSCPFPSFLYTLFASLPMKTELR